MEFFDSGDVGELAKVIQQKRQHEEDRYRGMVDLSDEWTRLMKETVPADDVSPLIFLMCARICAQQYVDMQMREVAKGHNNHTRGPVDFIEKLVEVFKENLDGAFGEEIGRRSRDRS